MEPVEVLVERARKALLDQKYMEFDRILAEISMIKDFKCIRGLVLLLDDSFEFDEILFSIIHTIENFDAETYINEIVAVLPELYTKAPEWSKIIVTRIRNNNESDRIFLQKLKSDILDTSH